MLRIFIYIIIAYLLYRILKSLFAKSKGIQKTGGGGIIDEMVQDPYCKTYIPRKGAKKKVIGGQEYFFCSDECASKFELEDKP
jgi:uncharacterized protein